nr:PREDICTED: sensory neuron membrane protein 1-like [Bemisia tabaci]
MQAAAKLIFIASVLAGATFYIHNFFFPDFMVKTMKEEKTLKRDGEIRKAWERAPIPLEFKVYLFNVTNPNEAAKGAKIHLQQVGPYVYDEWKSKANITDYPKEDAVTFHMLNTFVFDANKSGGLTGDELIYVPHVLIVGLASAILRMNPESIGYLDMAIPFLFGDPSTVFVPVTVRDLLFDGLPVNCNETHFAQAIFCNEFQKNPGFVRKDEQTFLFSIFGARNGTPDPIMFKVNRGLRNPQLVGEVMEYNRSKAQKVWSAAKCNEIRGTDSTILPSFVTKDGFDVFAADFCRVISSKFVRELDYKGIPAYEYTVDFGDPADSEKHCYCTSYETCLKKNTIDLTLCAGVPFVVSMPHFYLSDPEYVNAVGGLSPRKEEHEVVFVVEPMSGTPTMAKRRVQFNIILSRNSEIALLHDLNEKQVILPLFWVDEGVELGEKYLSQLRMLTGLPGMVNIGAIVIELIAGGLVIAAMYIKFGRARMGKQSPEGNN